MIKWSLSFRIAPLVWALAILACQSRMEGRTAESTPRARETNSTNSVQRALKARLEARYESAQKLAREGKQAEALQEYLWLFDEGMKQSPSFAGTRVSFLLT